MIPKLFPSVTEENLECYVVRGYNGLEQYAHKFWLNHILAYLKEGGFKDMGNSTDLLKALQEFASFSIESPIFPASGSPKSPLQPQTTNGADNQLLVLEKFPEIHGLVQQALVFRKKLKEAEHNLDSAECE